MANRDLVASYRRAIQAFNTNDLATTMEIVAPDIVYTFHGHNPVAGEYHGIDGFREVLERAKAATNGKASLEPLTVLSDENTVVVWGRFRGTRNGRTLETFHIYYYRFDQAGRLIEGHTIPVDQHVADQFWS